jgi:hypothetical protein
MAGNPGEINIKFAVRPPGQEYSGSQFDWAFDEKAYGPRIAKPSIGPKGRWKLASHSVAGKSTARQRLSENYSAAHGEEGASPSPCETHQSLLIP